jgi:CheY-like chemotaxis protein
VRKGKPCNSILHIYLLFLAKPYRNILLIDDDADDQELFLNAIKELTDSVICTLLDNAMSALQKLKTKQIQADLIFLDMNMPLMTGEEFLKELMKNEELKQIPVIVLSTSSQQETIRKTMSLGARDFFTKPAKFSDLKKMLKSIIGQG